MDPISNMVTVIKNGYLARRQFVSVPYSNQKETIAKKLNALGYVESVKSKNNNKFLEIYLSYNQGVPVVHDVKRISKPSLRIYSSATKIPRVLRGRGEVLLSTPKGILTGSEARKARIGGELLLKIW
jgi:small subunit ribosomal protein S8